MKPSSNNVFHKVLDNIRKCKLYCFYYYFTYSLDIDIFLFSWSIRPWGIISLETSLKSAGRKNLFDKRQVGLNIRVKSMPLMHHPASFCPFCWKMSWEALPSAVLNCRHLQHYHQSQLIKTGSGCVGLRLFPMIVSYLLVITSFSESLHASLWLMHNRILLQMVIKFIYSELSAEFPSFPVA